MSAVVLLLLPTVEGIQEEVNGRGRWPLRIHSESDDNFTRDFVSGEASDSLAVVELYVSALKVS